jgi:hypothetical protein
MASDLANTRGSVGRSELCPAEVVMANAARNEFGERRFTCMKIRGVAPAREAILITE